MNNRKIKFRIWYPYGDGGEMVKDVWLDLEKGSILSDNDDLCEREGHSAAVLLQFTGLYDKNGKEIYDGYIFKSTKSKAICKVNIGYYDDKTSSQHGIMGVWFEVINEEKPYDFTKAVLTKESASIIEIIGNIYENPNLFK